MTLEKTCHGGGLSGGELRPLQDLRNLLTPGSADAYLQTSWRLNECRSKGPISRLRSGAHKSLRPGRRGPRAEYDRAHACKGCGQKRHPVLRGEKAAKASPTRKTAAGSLKEVKGGA